VFFFLNYEGIRQVLDTTYVNYVPSTTLRQGIYNGAQYTVNPASSAMLSLYPLPNAPYNANVGIYDILRVFCPEPVPLTVETHERAVRIAERTGIQSISRNYPEFSAGAERCLFTAPFQQTVEKRTDYWTTCRGGRRGRAQRVHGVSHHCAEGRRQASGIADPEAPG
jgi:hypothetical protein